MRWSAVFTAVTAVAGCGDSSPCGPCGELPRGGRVAASAGAQDLSRWS